MFGDIITRCAGKLSKDSPSTLLARGVGADMVIRVSGAAAGILLHMLLARAMGTSGYGVFVYVFNWFLFLEAFSTMGFGRTIVRFAPAYRALREKALLRGLVSAGTAIAVASGMLLGCGQASVVAFLGDRLSPELVRTFYASALLLPVATLVNMVQDTLRAFNRIALALFPRMLLHQVLLALGVSILLITHAPPPTPSTVMAICVASMSLVLALQWRIRNRVIRADVAVESSARNVSEWLYVALPMLLTTVFQVTDKKAGILLVGALLQTTDAGLYAVANRLVQVLALGTNAVALCLAPLISQFFAEGKTQALQRTVTLASRGMVLFTLPAGAILVIAGRPLLHLFGNQFVGGYAALVLLVVAQCLRAVTGPLGELLLMTGHHKAVTVMMAATTALNIGLCVALIPAMGIAGAATATLLSQAVLRVTLLVLVHRKLRLNPTIFCFRSRPPAGEGTTA